MNDKSKIEIKSFLSKIEFSPQRRQGRRGGDFLFGGERPPNKEPSFVREHAYLAVPSP
jgi:hypothetical protein